MAKWQKVTIPIPKDLKPAQRKVIGAELLKFIRNRTEGGKGKGGTSFPAYSKAYQQSLDFKNAGKSSKVNLKLSGDMMAAMKIISTKPGQILYGFQNKTEENDRAEGNILGSYGGNPNAAKIRDFLHLTSEEIKDVLELKPSGGLEKLAKKLFDAGLLAITPASVSLATFLPLVRSGGLAFIIEEIEKDIKLGK